MISLDLSHDLKTTGKTFYSRIVFTPHFNTGKLLERYPVLAALSQEVLPRGQCTPRLGLVEALVLAPLLRRSKILRVLNLAGNEVSSCLACLPPRLLRHLASSPPRLVTASSPPRLVIASSPPRLVIASSPPHRLLAFTSRLPPICSSRTRRG